MPSFLLTSVLCLATVAQPDRAGEFTARLNDTWTNATERWVSIQFHDDSSTPLGTGRHWGFGVKRADLMGWPHADENTGDAVSRAYAADFQEQKPSVDDLVKMRIHGVTPEFVRQTRELGFKDLSIDDMVRMRIHRVTPEYIKEIRGLGYPDATLDQLVKLRIHRVTAAFIKEIRDLGYKNVSLDDYARMSIHGVTPEFIKEVRAMGFKEDMDADAIIELSIHGKRWLTMLKEKDKGKF